MSDNMPLWDDEEPESPRDRAKDERRRYSPSTWKYLTEPGGVRPGDEDSHGHRFGEWDPERY
jgi:hypothetical protein